MCSSACRFLPIEGRSKSPLPLAALTEFLGGWFVKTVFDLRLLLTPVSKARFRHTALSDLSGVLEKLLLLSLQRFCWFADDASPVDICTATKAVEVFHMAEGVLPPLARPYNTSAFPLSTIWCGNLPRATLRHRTPAVVSTRYRTSGLSELNGIARGKVCRDPQRTTVQENC